MDIVDGYLHRDGVQGAGGGVDEQWSEQTKIQVAELVGGGLWMVSGAGAGDGRVWKEECCRVERLGSESGGALCLGQVIATRPNELWRGWSEAGTAGNSLVMVGRDYTTTNHRLCVLGDIIFNIHLSI